MALLSSPTSFILLHHYLHHHYIYNYNYYTTTPRCICNVVIVIATKVNSIMMIFSKLDGSINAHIYVLVWPLCGGHSNPECNSPEISEGRRLLEGLPRDEHSTTSLNHVRVCCVSQLYDNTTLNTKNWATNAGGTLTVH